MWHANRAESRWCRWDNAAEVEACVMRRERAGLMPVAQNFGWLHPGAAATPRVHSWNDLKHSAHAPCSDTQTYAVGESTSRAFSFLLLFLFTFFRHHKQETVRPCLIFKITCSWITYSGRVMMVIFSGGMHHLTWPWETPWESMAFSLQ